MLEREIDVIERAVRQAGQEVVRISREGFETSLKENKDPLTTADLAANTILRTHVLEAFPEDGWLSEESVDDTRRLTCKRVWIVDPIDGTREFVRGIPEYALSVALVEDGHAILGVVHNPMTDEFFIAVKGQGASLNGQAIRVNDNTASPISVLGSRSDMKRGVFDALRDTMELRPMGSIAYKLAMVAAGQADSTISLTPKNEWDIAAGVLLVEEAGGVVTDLAEDAYRFNQKNTLVNGLVAASKANHTRILDMISNPNV